MIYFDCKQGTFNTWTSMYVNVKSLMHATYFGETPVGAGQAEDYRLKLAPRKASQ